jgi:hypothetical protein
VADKLGILRPYLKREQWAVREVTHLMGDCLEYLDLTEGGDFDSQHY